MTSEAAGLRSKIDQGHLARRAGRLDEALTHYRAALDMAPSNAEASSLYGLILLYLNRPSEAEPALRLAVEREPGHIGYRLNLAEFLERQGRLDEARAALREVTRLAPDFARAWERLGELSLRLQRPGDAFQYLARAVVLEPGNPAVTLKWSTTVFATRQFRQARSIIDRTLRVAPDNAAAFQLCVDMLTEEADWTTLERLARARVRARPLELAAWQAQTTAAFETGRPREAMELYRRVVELAGRDALRLTAFGQYCLNATEIDQARRALDEAEALDPDYAEMLSAKALLLTYCGQLEAAEAYCRRCLSHHPEHVAAYRVLNHLKHGRLSDEDRSALFRLSRQDDRRRAERIPASFALADCLDASGEFDDAFVEYTYANSVSLERARNENLDYDRPKRVTWTDQLIAAFNAPAPRVEEDLGPRPIFIVGMPRSGTTLVESVLAAHSRVFGCGERTVMPQILVDFLLEAKNRGLSNITRQRWTDWVRAYWYELPDVGGADLITDKNPFNFESVGLIAQLFPKSSIIHVRRNPVETSLSIFRNQFPKFVSFANRLEDIGHYYGQYARLAAHWERVLGEQFTTIQYEDFVGRFDESGPALLAKCGLDWEEACRNFDKSDRPIATLSAVQVREAINPGEGRARHYQRHLQPLIEALETAGVDLATGAVRS